uniref:alkaline phosphatase n=1 Tax=Ningiella ruwaisensis TaxID=2364274 RepID=UPI001F4F3A67|nr:alkaline phosphatase [Ningiella ruwaisensis]
MKQNIENATNKKASPLTRLINLSKSVAPISAGALLMFSAMAYSQTEALATAPLATSQSEQVASVNSLRIENQDVPKNIVMVIADGMGPAYVSAYRYFKDDPSTEAVETTIFDDILLGTQRTYPHAESGYVTDSAASATALATGFKTYNGAIGVNVNKEPLETVLHAARKQGMKTGLAVTSTIVHATPASYMVANEQRRNYEQIADSFFDDRINGQFLADVMLGAGQTHFIREDRNLVAAFEENGYQYLSDYSQLEDVDLSKPMIGLFGANSLPWALDDTNPHRLSALTSTALNALNNEAGFFLLVEASQVDWAGHANEIASAMAEMDDLAVAMQVLEKFAVEHPDTLVLLTADHSTGGLTVAGADGYRWDPKWLSNFKASVVTIAKEMMQHEDRKGYVEAQFGFELTEDEVAIIDSANSEMESRQIENLLKGIVNERTNTGWTTNGHTAVDVNIYGYGPGARHFSGNLNNTDIAERLFKLIKARQ